MLDLQEIKTKYPLLISYMKSQNYGKGYIRFIEKEINWILNESRHFQWKTYDDICQTYVEKWTNKHTVANRLRALSVIKRFVLESAVPDGSKHVHMSSNYDALCEDFKRFIDSYRGIVEQSQTMRSKTWYKSVEYTTSSFLMRLQKQGVTSFEQITEKIVLDVFSNDDKLRKNSGYKNSVATAFKIYQAHYPSGICNSILSFLPAIPQIRKNIQYLTDDEIKKIKSVLNYDSSLSLQNKAIGLLALYTGLRSCDIAALELEQIDWENDLIRIVQQKTGVPHVVPLSATVGNALFDYITKERPQSSEKYVFLTVNAPYRRFRTSNLGAICVTIMKKAGVRSDSGDKKGFHLFRHHLATRLLQNGVKQPVISRTLGHQCPQSLNRYLGADFKHLKECALSIECFTVKKEVFQ